MCYFVTLGIHIDDLNAVSAAIAEDTCLLVQRHLRIRARLPSEFEAHVLAKKGDQPCSSSLYSSVSDDESDSLEEKRSSYARKGWSSAKIDRALASKKVEIKRRLENSFVGLRPDLAASLTRIRPYLRGLFILIHFYSGSFDTDRFAVSETRLRTARLLDHESSLPENVLIELS